MKSTSDNYLENIVSLCPIEICHKEFLLQLFKECRPDLAFIGNIEEQQKEALIFQQFSIEQEQLNTMYPNAEFNIVMFNKEPIGRFYINYGSLSDHIVEIGLLESYRGLGIGKKIMNMAIENALKMGKNISLQVTWFNQGAHDFYEKLGFKTIEDNGVFCEMIYTI
ncbi:GNAT family N-acetyltransferase [Clostridium saccharoperbutylacetonicum]